MVREDSCHGYSGDGEGGLFGRRAAASCGGLQARQPESASAVACGGGGWDEPGRCSADRWHGPPDAAGLGAPLHERGPEGLKDSWSKGHPPRLSAEQLAQLAEVVETGPERAVHGVVRWRRVDLQQIVAERFGVAYHERTIGKILKQLGFSHVSARPRHPAKDEETVAAFKTYGPPRPQAAFASDLTGLRQRIRSRGRAPAKMEFRAPWPS